MPNHQEGRVAASTSNRASQPEEASHDRTDHFLATSFEEKSLWPSLVANLRGTLFPRQLPSLELTSTPIAASDRMAGRTNPWAIGTATAMNAGLLALLILLSLHTTIGHPPPSLSHRDLSLKDFTLIAPTGLLPAHGGGGGGSNSLTDPIVGRLPDRADMPIVPPQQPVLQNTILASNAEIAVPLDIKLPDNSKIPTIGVDISPNVKLVSGGTGTRAGIGSGSNGGDGPGKGPGYGPGSDGGYGGSVYSPGVGGVSKPIATFAPTAEFSDEARRQKYEGLCIVSIIVDAQGNPQNLRITRSLGMGLDEKALEAVRQYRFKPAIQDGKPVASYVSVEINFHLF